MKAAKSYLITVFSGLLFFILLWLAVFYLQLGMPTPASEQADTLFTLKTLAAKQITSPKIVIIAGSSAHFAVNAEKITQALGRPTINFGVYAGLEPAYFLYKAKEILKPGDTAILALEYIFYTYTPNFNPYGEVYVDHLLARDPHFFHSLPVIDQLEIMAALPLSRLIRPFKLAFFRQAPLNSSLCAKLYYNAYGDTHNNNRICMNEQTRTIKKAALPDSGLSMPSKDARIWEVLRSFAAWCKDNHIQLLATAPNHRYFPGLINNNTRASIEKIKAMYVALGIPFIGNPFQAMFDKRFYFDRTYHVNELGKELYTQQLIDSLKKEKAVTWPVNNSLASLASTSAQNALDLALVRFNGWESLAGLEPVSKTKGIVQAQGQKEILLKALVQERGKIYFHAQFQPLTNQQTMRITIDGKPIWQQIYADSKKLYNVALALPTEKGEHLIKIEAIKGSHSKNYSENYWVFKALEIRA